MKYLFIYTTIFVAAILLLILFIIDRSVKFIYLFLVFSWDFKVKQTHILKEFHLHMPFLLQLIFKKLR